MPTTKLEMFIREMFTMAGGAIAALYFLAHQRPPLWLVVGFILLAVAKLATIRKNQWLKDHPTSFGTCVAIGFLAVIAQAAIGGGLHWQPAAIAATVVILVWVLNIAMGKRAEHNP